MKKKKNIPIILFIIVTVIGIVLFLDNKTPYAVLSYWLRSESSLDDYLYALAHFDAVNIAYHSGIAFMIIGIMGTTISAVVIRIFKPTHVKDTTEIIDVSQKTCPYCGNEILAQAIVCPKCGCAVAQSSETDTASAGLNLLSFLVPLAGLILFCIYTDKAPNKAKSIGKWAIIGVCVSIGLTVLLYLILLLL